MNKYVKYSLMAIPLLTGGYFLWKYLSKKDEPSVGETSDDNSGSGTSSSSSVFPLKRGSKGAKVKELQLILLKGDPNILPKYGADSDFGSETESALLKLFYRTSIKSQQELDSLLGKLPEKVYTKAELSAKSKSFVANQFMQRKVQATKATQVVTGNVVQVFSVMPPAPPPTYTVDAYIDRPSGYQIPFISLKEDTDTGLLYVIESGNKYQRVNPFHFKLV